MPAITDPADLAILNGSAGAPVAAPAMTGAVTDPGDIAELEKNATTASTAPAPAASSANAPVTPQKESGLSPGNIGTMILSEIPFADRALAGVAALTGMAPDYETALAAERGLKNRLATQHPVENTALGLGGATAGLAAAPLVSAATPLGAAATGAAYGGLQGASASPDLTNLPQTAKDAGLGAATGAALGAVVPPLASGLGNAATKVANAVLARSAGDISAPATAKILPSLVAQGLPQTAQRLGELGPEGMLADTGPAMLATTQGAALQNPEALQTAFSTLKQRADGTIARLNQGVNSALGPAVSPVEMTNQIQGLRQFEHQALPSIYASAPPVDTMPIIQQIDQKLTTAVGPERAALTQARNYLVKPGPVINGQQMSVPIDNAQILGNAKTALGTVMQNGDQSLGIPPGALAKADGATKYIYGQINQALKDQVPGYEDVMNKSAELARKADAIEQGYGLLEGGKSATFPTDLASQLAKSGPEVREGLQIGTRAAIANRLGTNPNDLATLTRTMQAGPGQELAAPSFNQQNLAMIHSPQAVDQISSLIDQNKAFNNTFNKVSEGSQTQMRNAAERRMAPAAPADLNTIPLINPNMRLTGAALTGAKRLGEGLLNYLRPNPADVSGEIARVLTAQGPQAQGYLGMLADNLMRQGRNAQLGTAAGKNAAIAAALLSGHAARARLLAPPAETQ